MYGRELGYKSDLGQVKRDRGCETGEWMKEGMDDWRPVKTDGMSNLKDYYE